MDHNSAAEHNISEAMAELSRRGLTCAACRALGEIMDKETDKVRDYTTDKALKQLRKRFRSQHLCKSANYKNIALDTRPYMGEWARIVIDVNEHVKELKIPGELASIKTGGHKDIRLDAAIRTTLVDACPGFLSSYMEHYLHDLEDNL